MAITLMEYLGMQITRLPINGRRNPSPKWSIPGDKHKGDLRMRITSRLYEEETITYVLYRYPATFTFT